MSKHNIGNIISLTKYAKVLSNSGSTLSCVDVHDGGKFEIHGQSLQDTCLSADKFEKTQRMGKIELAEVLVKSYGKVFTVVFDKADGSERTLRGRLLSSEGLLGRSSVEDLDVTGDNKIRQVDHRTLQSIVVDGIKYTLK